MSDIDNIRSALSYIEPHDRDDWWHIGAALKDELGENGFDLWDEWSQRADNYSSRTAQATWKSLKPNIWHIETVWKMARQNGWKPDKPYTPPSAEDMARRKAESEARRLATEAERKQTQQKVKGTAKTIWKNSRPADINHPYLAAKGIADIAAISGLRQNEYKGDNNLVIPVLYEREIVNLQSINQDGGKRFLAGGQVEGGYAFLGKSEDIANGVVLAEGYATAASIHQATGKPVIIAFNAGNMVTVSERLAKTLPEQVPVVIAVDNDASQTGMKKAQQAAAFFNGRATAVQPEFTMTQIQQFQKGKGIDEKGRPPLPSDFNDLHKLAGIEAVRSTFENSFRRPKTLTSEPLNTSPEQEQEMKSETQATLSETPETNTIEFDGKTQETKRSETKSQFEQHEPKQTPQADKEAETSSKPESQAEERPSEKAQKAILDLEYRIPEHLKTRYHAIGGKFYSIKDGKTVLFEDKGKKLKTSLQDPQTVKDMLEVVKAKGWDSIKLSGSKEFKQMMFIEAAAQGIKTRGYTPTTADLQQVEALRERYAKNEIEPILRQEQQQQTEADKANQPEKNQAADKDTQSRSEPDREMLSAADRLKAQSEMPSESQVNSSPRADTDIDIPLHDIGQEEVPAEVLHQTDNMKTAALDTHLVSAKTSYMQKAQKLSKKEQKKLAFYERGVIDTLRGVEGHTRTDALRNYYEHTAKMMKGSKLDLPHPVQIPTHSQTHSNQKPMNEAIHYQERNQEHEPEISR